MDSVDTACDPTQRSPRRVGVVSPVFGGSFPVAAAAAKALSALGHEVTFLDLRGFAQAYLQARQRGSAAAQAEFYDAVRSHVEVRVDNARCELLLALAQAPVGRALLDDLRTSGVVSALWFVEHYQRFKSWQTLAAHYDWVFRIQEAPFDAALRAAGARNQAYLPLAATPGPGLVDNPEEEGAFRSSLAFFGSPYQNRIALFSGLADRGLALWGKGWSDVRGSLARCVRIGDRYLGEACEARVYRGADIVLNLHSEVAGETVRDYLNPRTFQVASAGRFQLVDQRTLLARHFSSDEIVAFGSATDLRAKVDQYLARPEMREAIARAARRRVLAEHTYAHRMRAVLAHTLEHRS